MVEFTMIEHLLHDAAAAAFGVVLYLLLRPRPKRAW